MKKVLIAGGCGYIGARLSKYLAENGYAVTVVCRRDPGNYPSWIHLMEEVIVGDIRNEETITKISGKDYDAAIYLISLDHRKSEENVNLTLSTNVAPVWNLLEKLSKQGLQRFIYFSTIQVYGKIPNRVIDEEFPPAPMNAYGLSHLLCENICDYFDRKTDTRCISVRLSNSYGNPVFKENNCWWLVINDLCISAMEKGRIPLLSDGSPQRDFIHGSDVAKAAEALLKIDTGLLVQNKFHIASGNTVTILELAHMVKKVYENKYSKEIDVYLPGGSVSTDSDVFQSLEKYRLKTDKMEALGFCPRTSLAEGIDELFEYLEQR